jgi:hypothetical protein
MSSAWNYGLTNFSVTYNNLVTQTMWAYDVQDVVSEAQRTTSMYGWGDVVKIEKVVTA